MKLIFWHNVATLNLIQSDRPLDIPYNQNSNFDNFFADYAFLQKNNILNFWSELTKYCIDFLSRGLSELYSL